MPDERNRRGRMATERPERYAKQLAAHWARKADTSQDGDRTVISFGGGEVVVLTACPGLLDITVTVPAGADADRFAGVVAEHLQRFGTREELAVTWDGA